MDAALGFALAVQRPHDFSERARSSRNLEDTVLWYVVLAVAILVSQVGYPVPNAAAQSVQLQTEPIQPNATFITTSDGVQLEVLDYGGQGSPVLLISGSGATAHAFDEFAPRLAIHHRVYGLTRRSYGVSGTPPLDPANYSIRRLAQDVVDVLDKLGIEKATLIGWSFGGAELSGVAQHAPERVSALVYLDAAYAYAFYAPGNASPDGAVSPTTTCLRQARLGQGTRSLSGERLPLGQGG